MYKKYSNNNCSEILKVLYLSNIVLFYGKENNHYNCNMKKSFTHCLLLPVMALADNPPLMGWSSWNTYGFQINVSVVKAQADAMVKLGFKERGYNHINIDDGFFGGRDAEGKLLIHATRFPDGMRPVVDYIHGLGLKAGIYSDAGRNTCASY